MQDRQDRQRSICLTTSAVGGAVLLQHLLDEIDSAARAIELVAEQDIGRTGRGAEPAMHALAQDGVGFGDIWIGQLSGAEFGLHATSVPVLTFVPCCCACLYECQSQRNTSKYSLLVRVLDLTF